jgi:hypothetical protein
MKLLFPTSSLLKKEKEGSTKRHAKRVKKRGKKRFTKLSEILKVVFGPFFYLSFLFFFLLFLFFFFT